LLGVVVVVVVNADDVGDAGVLAIVMDVMA
jgi:hypothetical protein